MLPWMWLAPEESTDVFTTGTMPLLCHWGAVPKARLDFKVQKGTRTEILLKIRGKSRKIELRSFTLYQFQYSCCILAIAFNPLGHPKTKPNRYILQESALLVMRLISFFLIHYMLASLQPLTLCSTVHTLSEKMLPLACLNQLLTNSTGMPHNSCTEKGSVKSFSLHLPYTTHHARNLQCISFNICFNFIFFQK